MGGGYTDWVRTARSESVLNFNGLQGTFPQSGNYGRLALDPYDDPWLTNAVGFERVLELTNSGNRELRRILGGWRAPGARSSGFRRLWESVGDE